MAITFREALTVEEGERITSAQLQSLVDAYNDRMRTGLFEIWRLFYYWHALFVKPRNDADEFAATPQGEFWDIYQLIQAFQAQWPTAGPGEPEGANVSNIFNAFIFGAAALNLDAEDIRLDIDIGFGEPSTPEGIWDLRKRQAGAYEPDSGALASPAFTAARSFAKIYQSTISPHGNSYGGYRPVPLTIGADSDGDGDGDCNDASGPVPAHKNYQLFFTKLDDSFTCPVHSTDDGMGHCLFNGTCPANPDDVAASILLPWGVYIVFFYSGEITFVPANQFIEGPYRGGGALRKGWGDHLQRCMNIFIREFRGSDSQRADETYFLQEAFDFQKVITSQYHLAPNVGTFSEDGLGIDLVYPEFTFDGSRTLQPGEQAIHTQSGTTQHAYHPDTVLHGYLVTATNLAYPVGIGQTENGVLRATFALTPDAEGHASRILYLSSPYTPEALGFLLTSVAQFKPGGGSITIEADEKAAYKPELWDLYMILRNYAADFDRAVDGVGIDETRSREICNFYLTKGCVINFDNHSGLPGSPDGQVNNNAVFDAARRASLCVRAVSRRNLIGYELDGEGRSVLYFTRYAYGLDGDAAADIFQGIAPERLPIPADEPLVWGRTYLVRSGEITTGTGEDRRFLRAGDEFTAEEKGQKFSFTTPGEVFEKEGIRHTAEPQGVTNEWLMMPQFKPYHTSESSIWKPDGVGGSDLYPLNNRACFFGTTLHTNPDLLFHFCHGIPETYAEAPTSYNYAKTNSGPAMNSAPEVTLDFYKSCPIYEKCPEVHSVTIQMEGATEVVKMVFTERFQHHPDADAVIARDTSTWDPATLDTDGVTGEVYRTVENGIRQYLLQNDTGRNLNRKVGDAAAKTVLWGNPDQPFATCFPTLLFAQLMPGPYHDDNNTVEEIDSRILHDVMLQGEIYLRAFCEGCVDEAATVALACGGNDRLMDFTYQNLAFAAHGGRGMTTVDSRQRPDKPQGFGPIPNVECRAEVYNQQALMLNLCNRFRVMFPCKVTCEARDYADLTEVRILDPDGVDAGDYTEVSDVHGWWSGSAAQAGTLRATTPGDCTVDGFYAQQRMRIEPAISTFPDFATFTGPGWPLIRNRRETSFTVGVSDPDAIYAVPEDWRDMALINLGVLARLVAETDTNSFKTLVASSLDGDFCGLEDGFWHRSSDGLYLKFDSVQTFDPVDYPMTLTGNCIMLTSGVLQAPPIGVQTLRAGRSNAGGLHNCFAESGNTVSIEVLTTEESYLEVPLVAPDDP